MLVQGCPADGSTFESGDEDPGAILVSEWQLLINSTECTYKVLLKILTA